MIHSKPVFLALCAQYGIPKPEDEYRFHPDRKWRFDYAWPDFKVALEIEGGAWTGGRHNRGNGFIADMEKYNAAAQLGWRLIRITPQQVLTTKTVETLKACLKV